MIAPGLISILSAGTPTIRPGSIFGMPEQASTVAPHVDLIYDVITWISVFFFVLIVAVMGYFVFRYRRTTHLADTSGPTHNTPLEVTWTVIPLILVIAIFYIGLQGYVHITTAPENSYEIQVTGQRWFWTFNYPNGASETNVLHVPVGRPVKLIMRSDDVIHSVFIPAFRVKQDVVPGKRTTLWFEATRTGDFDLFCTEYCGMQHSQMVGRVMVYEPDEFEVVIEAAARWIEKVPDELLHLAGTQFYNQCAACHTLDGSKFIAPSFKETHDLFVNGGSRTLTDGTIVTVDEQYIRHSILDPPAEVVDTYTSAMPPGIGTQLGDRKVEAMVRFIMQLDETAPGGQLREVARAELTELGAEPEGE